MSRVQFPVKDYVIGNDFQNFALGKNRGKIFIYT